VKNIVVLAFDGAQALDIAGPMEVFSGGNHFATKPAYRIECLGLGITPTRMSNGLRLALRHYSAWRGKIDTIIVPGASEQALDSLRSNTKFIHWLSAQLPKARRIVSVCTGAFVLAELGFLEGRKVSTHWAACERLQQFAPNTKVDADAIFTKDGNLYTSAGVTTGIDLALSLVEEDLGKEVSLNIARNLVLYLRRPGGQSQFSVPLELQSSRETRIEKVIDYIRNNPQANLTLDALADRFSMSSRHLSRLFNSQAGLSPAKYVSSARLNVVKTYLETTEIDLKHIAAKCGYASQSTMAKIFKQRFGVAPSTYRARFN
jgi:transcriptional regulator GlxA family with amidase domain